MRRQECVGPGFSPRVQHHYRGDHLSAATEVSAVKVASTPFRRQALQGGRSARSLEVKATEQTGGGRAEDKLGA